MTTSNIRKFYLINANKEIYDLQDTSHFGHKPSGLGVSLSTNSISENGYFEVLSQTSNQVTISFEMMFGGENKINQYKLFNDFTKFLDYQPLQINYITDAFNYYADITVNQIEKSEIDPDGILRSNVSFLRTTPWYVEKEIVIGARPWPENTGKIYYIPNENNSGGSKYNYAYGVNLDIPTRAEETFSIPTSFKDPANGGFGTKLRITSLVNGFQSPYIRLVTSGGQYLTNIVQEDKYIMTLNKGEYIEISSFSGNYYAYKFNADGSYAGNIYQLQDFNTQGFLKVWPGDNFIFMVPSTPDVKLTLVYREEAVIA